MSNLRPIKSSRSSKFLSPKSCKSSSDKFKTFASETSDNSDNEEVRNAFASFNYDLQQLMNEVNSLKNENSGLRDQLKQTSQEKLNLIQQFEGSRGSLEKQVNELKFALDKEEQLRKNAIYEVQRMRDEMELKVKQVLNEKTVSENRLKKEIEKNKEGFKRIAENKDSKIRKLLGTLNSVKEIESQVKSMLSEKESYAVAQSAGNLPNRSTSKHIKSRSCIPYE